MATILAHIQIRPGKEARFEELQGALWRSTHANEPDTTRYEFFRGEKEGWYYGLLSFKDFQAFLVHQSSDAHEEFGGQFGDVVQDIRIEWVDAIEGANALAPTAPQDAPPGASDLVRKYSKDYAVRMADWWKALRN
ncbi:antibiotic biosynthesis monooxygenase [Emcibacter sp. SYSU 3D8]|uniref:putative quinol monooxygenase n=1 Tax=Emcibacter sp. SYSU 3D8 TaxID=3133969 RepID=UPI0031FE4C55